jgi:uncharacterized membrane protein YfbV (UPF0208 family)
MLNQMLTLINDGRAYSKIWPLKPQLATIFIEYRVIKATNLAINLLPMLAVLSLMVQVSLLGYDYMPQAITCSLFLLSMPIQGLYWLGKRANTVLPVAMANWYRQIHEQMSEEGCQMPSAAKQPHYHELAELLKTAFDKMDNGFTKNMF